MVKDITTGTRTLARGLRLLNKPGIRVYVIIPLLINLILFGALVWYGHSLFTSAVDWFMNLSLVVWLTNLMPSLQGFIEGFLWLFFGVFAAIVVFFAFTPVANIVAAPFNALMSEKIEALLTGIPAANDTSFVQMAIDTISSQLRKLLYIALWALGLFLVSLIPVINLIAPLLWFVFGSWLISLEYLDYPMGNHELTFAEQKRRLAERRGLSLGFGGAVMIMTSIPIVNFFVMPVAVAGATVLWVEQFNSSTESAHA